MEGIDAIARAKDIAERNLQNARELFESCLTYEFSNFDQGTTFKKLSEVVMFLRSLTVKLDALSAEITKLESIKV